MKPRYQVETTEVGKSQLPITPITNVARALPLCAAAMLALACSPSEQDGADGAAANGGDASAGTDAGSSAAGAQASSTMARTAWRVIGEDGAIYTTFFDPDGSYRDYRNGDPWHRGKWARQGGGRLCFSPEGERRWGEYWTNETPDNQGVMLSTSDTGRMIELRRVTYIAPIDRPQNADETTGSIGAGGSAANPRESE